MGASSSIGAAKVAPKGAASALQQRNNKTAVHSHKDVLLAGDRAPLQFMINFLSSNGLTVQTYAEDEDMSLLVRGNSRIVAQSTVCVIFITADMMDKFEQCIASYGDSNDIRVTGLYMVVTNKDKSVVVPVVSQEARSHPKWSEFADNYLAEENIFPINQAAQAYGDAIYDKIMDIIDATILVPQFDNSTLQPSSSGRLFLDSSNTGGGEIDIFDAEAHAAASKAETYYKLAQSFQAAHNLPDAAKWYKQAGDLGHVASQYAYGMCLLLGEGIPRDEVEAVRHLRHAAKQHHRAAQNVLGECYLHGVGVKPHARRAFRMFYYASKGEVPQALYNLGYCYLTGAGIDQDTELAMRYLQVAAAANSVAAEYQLGECYADGLGVEQDDIIAIQWYTRAATHGHSGAAYILGAHYASLQQHEQSLEWMLRSAYSGHAQAQHAMAKTILMKTMRTQFTTEDAINWLRSSANQGLAEAQWDLGNCYFQGLHSLDRNLTFAVTLFSLAAEQGLQQAQLQLATCYKEGLGVEKDRDIGDRWYAIAMGAQNPSEHHDESSDIAYMVTEMSTP